MVSNLLVIVCLGKPMIVRKSKGCSYRKDETQAPAMSTIMFVSLSNSPMVSEKKIVSTASLSCLPIILFSGSLEIHLVSRVSIVGSRADLIRLMVYLASVGFLPFFQTLSLGYFKVVSDYLKLSRAAVSRIQVKIICGSLYYEQVSLCNTSIPYFIVLVLLLFILLPSIPPVVIVVAS